MKTEGVNRVNAMDWVHRSQGIFFCIGDLLLHQSFPLVFWVVKKQGAFTIWTWGHLIGGIPRRSPRLHRLKVSLFGLMVVIQRLNFATIPRHSFFGHQEIFWDFSSKHGDLFFSYEIGFGKSKLAMVFHTSKHNFCLWHEHPFTNHFDVHQGGWSMGWFSPVPRFVCFGGAAAWKFPSKKVPWNNRCNRARPNLVGDRFHWIFNFH